MAAQMPLLTFMISPGPASKKDLGHLKVLRHTSDKPVTVQMKNSFWTRKQLFWEPQMMLGQVHIQITPHASQTPTPSAPSPRAYHHPTPPACPIISNPPPSDSYAQKEARDHQSSPDPPPSPRTQLSHSRLSDLGRGPSPLSVSVSSPVNRLRRICFVQSLWGLRESSVPRPEFPILAPPPTLH